MIYFIENPANRLVKIGTTIRLSLRFKSLITEHGNELKLLGVMDGGRDFEQELHERFARWRVSGEWFRSSPDLIAFIEDECREWDGEDESPIHAVLLNQELYAKVRKVAALKEISVPEYLNEILCPIVDRDLITEARKFAREGGPS